MALIETEEGRGAGAAPLRPGLDVAVGTLGGIDGRDAVSVHVRVRGGDGPVQMFLYFDGELVETWSSERVARWEFRPADVTRARHAVTARAIDARGRWGGASTIVDTTSLPNAPPV
jgi:hypothetical protein